MKRIGLTRLRSLAYCAVLAGIVAAVLTGCGGGSSSSSTSGGAETSGSGGTETSGSGGDSGGGGSAAVEAAEAEVAKYTKTQAPLKIAALGGAPAKGKNLALMTCQPSACVGAIAGAEEGAKALGWSFRKFNNPFTPEGYAAAWDEIVQSRPDGVVYVGVLPNELIEKQLAELKKLDIPIMGISPARISAEPGSGSVTPGGPIYGAFAAEPQFGLSGKLMGDIIVSDHGGAPDKTVLLWDKTQEANLGIIKEEFEKVMNGAGGEVELLEVSFEQEGKGIPGQVVSYLQRNPEVEYVAIQASEYSIGVPAAVQAAGFGDKVKIVGRVPDAANVDQIKNGEMFAAIAEEDRTLGWRGVNGLVQLFAGKDDFEPEPTGWHQIITADNVDEFKLDSLGSPAVPGDPEAFLESWGQG